MRRYDTHGVGNRGELAGRKVSNGTSILEAVVCGSIHASCWRIAMEICMQRPLGEVDNVCTL